jgi:hypothetical protein
MFEDSIGCWVSRFTVENRLAADLTDKEWNQVLECIDSDVVEDTIMALVKDVLTSGVICDSGEGGRNA